MIEANTFGTPVLATNSKGLSDSVRDGETGLLSKVRDEKSLAFAMEAIISDSSLRKRLSENALDWSKNFSWDKTTNEFLNVVLNVKNDDDSDFIGNPALEKETIK